MLALCGLALLVGGCSREPRHLDEALAGQPAGVYAYFQTDLGDFLARLFIERAPRTTANFIGLAEGTKEWVEPKSEKWVTGPFYDGLLFFKVIDNEFILTGDPLHLGIGGPGYQLDPEFHPELRHDRAGLLTVPPQGEEEKASGSQFMITLGPRPTADDRSSIFGEVVWGMETVRAIGRIPTHMDNRPVKDIKLRRVTIHRVGGAREATVADDAPTTAPATTTPETTAAAESTEVAPPD